jgi:protein O-mannosyl-transferase
VQVVIAKTIRQPRTREPKTRSKKTGASSYPNKPNSLLPLALAVVLSVGTLVLYSPVRGHDFINYDDNGYVVDNSHVKSGLSWEMLRWSVTSRDEANWHPLTWWSHAADCEFFGLDAGSHHLVNALIHSANALLLFLLLYWATRALTQSFLVAGMFAWHPFNVESVAWVAERKNVLCTFFFFLALAAYGWYARRPNSKRMLVVCFIFVLALAAKPMAVTFPFVLLLSDYWPLRRVAGWTTPSPESSIPQQSVVQLLLDKIPLFLLTAAASAVTVWAQSAGALRSIQAFPFSARLANALYSYLVYVVKTFWPFHFGLYYPHPGVSIPLWKPTLAAVVLAAISFAAWMQRATRPYLIVGWLCFLGVLFPMIGAVQVGDQGMADRYAYLSIIGLFIMFAWGTAELLDKFGAAKQVRWALVVIVLVLLCVLTSQQISYWENSVSIWSHTIDATKSNAVAERKLAFALVSQGSNEDAVVHFVNAVNIDPSDVASRVNLGAYYAAHDRLPDAMQEFQTAIALTNDSRKLSVEDKNYRGSALLDLGFAYALSKDYPQALATLKAANQDNSALVDRTENAIARALTNQPSEDANLKMGLLLRAEGRNEEAVSALQNAVSTNPQYSRIRDLLQFLSTYQN